MRLKVFRVVALIAACALPAVSQTPPQTPPTRIRGVIETFTAPILTVKTQDGQTVSVKVPADLPIMANAKASLADIKPGDFVASAADKGPDGKQHAEEVRIFPEAMRGAGEGHRPMAPDPNRAVTNRTVGGAANDPEARTMTNGTVRATANDPEARTMTNGTVSRVAGAQTVVLQVEYKGGVQEIEVSPDVPVTTIVVADSSLLKPGATVSLAAIQKDGGLVATNLTAEKDGIKPR